MKRRFNRTQRNYIIAGLCMILVIMGVGYAAFSSQLKISGTSSISGSFNIQITNIETMLPSDYGSEYPDGYNISEPTYTPTSATFSAGFELPGSMIGYIVEVSNLGSIDGQVGIGNLSCGDNSAIMCQAMATDEEGTNGFNFDYGNQDYSDINFPLKVGEKHYIMVMVAYADVTEQPTDLDASIKLDLTYEQYKDPNVPIPSGETTLIGGQEVDLVSGGDGLYEDSYESGRLIYRGQNPDNYIMFNDELWRIISKEADGTYKILKNELLPEQAWDSSNSNNWIRPATLNTYLNGEYYTNLDSSIKDNIVSHTWGIGAPSFEDNQEGEINKVIEDEKETTWNGSVGLISLSDYALANSNVASCESMMDLNMNSEMCRTTNWMYISGSYWWTISPDAGYSRSVWIVLVDGSLFSNDAFNSTTAPRPAVYLKSDITLSGSGTSLDPFKIVS